MATFEELEARLKTSGLVIFDGDHRFAMARVVPGTRLSGDWTQFVCLRCGCMYVRMANGEHFYRARRIFSLPKQVAPKCFLHSRSEYEASIRRLIG